MQNPVGYYKPTNNKKKDITKYLDTNLAIFI